MLSCWLVVVWHHEPCQNMKSVEWLEGKWENVTPKGSVYEQWEVRDNGGMKGKSYRLDGLDTILFETIDMVCQEDYIYYIPTVSGQNQGKPVKFKARSINESRMIFENKNHDFPQFISYFKIGQDSLEATISGMVNGFERSQRFRMRRLQ